MSVGILIITHNEIGDALLRTAINTMGGICPLDAAVLSITDTNDLDSLQETAKQMVQRLDTGMGVLVMTDAYGSTPGNIATSLIQRGTVEVLAGINLPMLIKAFNYSKLDLAELIVKALSGAQKAIIQCP